MDLEAIKLLEKITAKKIKLLNNMESDLNFRADYSAVIILDLREKKLAISKPFSDYFVKY
jgi:hypothetical protein